MFVEKFFDPFIYARQEVMHLEYKSVLWCNIAEYFIDFGGGDVAVTKLNSPSEYTCLTQTSP